MNTEEQDTLDLHTGDQVVGNVPPGPASADPPSESPARPREEPLKVTVKRRLEQEGRWAGRIEKERDEMMRMAKDRFPSKEERQAWVYAELDRMYPPPELSQPDLCKHDNVGSGSPDNPTMSGQPILTEPIKQGVSEPPNPPLAGSDGQIQGLGEIPSDWPTLPANASLGMEVGWVQANRLRVVEERPRRATLIRLDRALSPAPSWAALGWLETSIRSYAKFVDVAAKVSGPDDGESSVMRRERMAIEEVEALLAEMLPGPPCPTCGQATSSDWKQANPEADRSADRKSNQLPPPSLGLQLDGPHPAARQFWVQNR